MTERPLVVLDMITTHVLNYRPPEKGQAVEKAQEKLPKKPRKKKNQNSAI